MKQTTHTSHHFSRTDEDQDTAECPVCVESQTPTSGFAERTHEHRRGSCHRT